MEKRTVINKAVGRKHGKKRKYEKTRIKRKKYQYVMSELNYIIINPLQIELLLPANKKRKLTEIEGRFFDKMEKLKNISLENKQLKYILHHIKNRVILVDV